MTAECTQKTQEKPGQGLKSHVCSLCRTQGVSKVLKEKGDMGKVEKTGDTTLRRQIGERIPGQVPIIG